MLSAPAQQSAVASFASDPIASESIASASFASASFFSAAKEVKVEAVASVVGLPGVESTDSLADRENYTRRIERRIRDTLPESRRLHSTAMLDEVFSEFDVLQDRGKLPLNDRPFSKTKSHLKTELIDAAFAELPNLLPELTSNFE